MTRHRWLFLAAAMLAATSCSAEDPDTADRNAGSTSDCPPATAPPATLGSVTACLGDAVVHLDVTWGDGSDDAAALGWDGTWRNVPRPDGDGVRRVLGGRHALVTPVKEGDRFPIQRLRVGASSWESLDGPGDDVTDETEFWEVGGANGYSVFGTSFGTVISMPSGEVEVVEMADSRLSRMQCVAGSTLFELRSGRRSGNGYSGLPRELLALDLADLDAGWVTLDPTPADLAELALAQTCARNPD